MAWKWRTGIVAGLVALAVAAPAHAVDSLAPPGAAPHWLPREDWVKHHWLDEGELAAALGLGAGELEAYLYNDHRSLADLATLRGISVAQLVQRLTAWTAELSATRRGLVVDHATRMLTQPHLAQHVLFHIYHYFDVRRHARRAFHLGGRRYWRLRARGLSCRRIARIGGVDPAHVLATLTTAFARDRDEGLRRQLMPPGEAARFFSRRVDLLACWFSRPLAHFDATNPYGHQAQMHGHFYTHMPTSTVERRRNDAAVEHHRKSIRPGCWPIPAAWNWAAHGLTSP